MQLRGEQLTAHLDRELRPLYVLYGDEPLLVLEAADSIRARARQRGFSERQVLTALPGFDWGELASAGGNLSLFGDRQLIDLRIPSGKPGKEGSAALQAWAKAPSPDNLLLVTLPALDWRDEKAAWLTALSEAGVAVKLNAPPLTELPGWLTGRLKRQQQSADYESLQFLAERVEGNLLAAHQEIQKLALLYPPGKLSLAQIRDAVLNVARYDIDGLREALLAGDLPRLARTLSGLRQEGEAPPLVLWAITEEIRTLLQIRQGLDRQRPLDQLLKEAKVWGPRQGPVRKAVSRLTAPRLEQALREAAATDRLAKGIGQGDLWESLQRLALLVCQPG